MARPKKPIKDKPVRLTVYLSPNVMAEIEERARSDRRSVSMTALMMIERCLSDA